MVSTDERIAHSAEHAFIGSLQKILGRTLRVRKVEHKGKKNSAFIIDDRISLREVLEAEKMVNLLIAKGTKLREYHFASLDDARKSIPSLRANEERITGPVRVVEIEGHDQAACIMEHASSLGECNFFLVTGLSKSGKEYEVNFAVGEYAKDEARRITSILLGICSDLGANLNTIENTVKKLRAQDELNSAKLGALTKKAVDGSKVEKHGDVVLRQGIFADLDDDVIVEYAGQLIQTERSIAVFVNTVGETSRFVLAKSESLGQPDFRVMLQSCPGSPKGGGKPHFVTGIVDSLAAESFVNSVMLQIDKNSLKVR